MTTVEAKAGGEKLTGGTSAAKHAAPEDAPALTHRQILVILSGLMLGMFLAALDQTIVGTSIRTIADDLNGLSMQAWATTAYLITSTISTPLYGKLSDIYGRKPFFVTAISIFLVGSLACTLSTSMYELAAFRALQGLGAGGLMSLALTIIADIVPPRERAKYQGYFLAVFGTSSVLGPVIGGFFAGTDSILGVTGWRWVFLVNVPIGALALVVVTKVLNVPHQRRDHRIDYFGAAFLSMTVVPLLVVAEQGREWGWDSTRSIACYAIGLVGLVAFLFVENRMGDEALIPLRLFRTSTFAMTIIAGTVIGVGMFGGISMIPQYLQIVRGLTPTEAGLFMIPMMLGIMIASVASGQITSRTGRYKVFPVLGSALLVVGLLLFHGVEVDTPIWQPMVYMTVFGLGLGNCMQTLTIAAQNAVPVRDMGVATASATFFRQLGGTLGVAVFLSLLFSTVADNIASAFTRAAQDPAFQAAASDPAVRDNPVNQPVFAALNGGGGGGVLQDSSFLQTIDPRLALPFQQGFTESIQLVFLAGAGVMVLAFVVSLFIKEIPLRLTNSVSAAALEGGEAMLPTEEDRDDDRADGTTADGRANGAVAASESNGSNGHHGNGVGGFPAEDPDREGFLPFQPSALRASAVGDAPVLSGQVRRPDGSALVGAALTLIDAHGQQVGRVGTGHDGGYLLDAPLPGAYTLIASAPDHQPQATTVKVRAGQATVDVTLVGAAVLHGYVMAADGHTPVTTARVTLTDGRGEVVETQPSASDGSYRFAGVRAGSFTLVVSADTFRPAALPLTLPATGEVRHDVELVGGAELSGVARTTTGSPVPDARITVLDAAGGVVTVTSTDDEGRYVVDDLAEGDYTVIASGYSPTADQVSLRGGEVGTHDVTLGYDEWK
ncbi:multidrug transporter, MFS superfamily [Actinokineospora spheciospongiae]|uniref:Multidrug transporter, MFS superfamily n=1 Tax=Actinokineospora spheciospongiae TaxID=909613 RepID=W7IXG1_9PSEU|nr:MFS transporter [Actinokineospora spheciospongiae]EWC61532.1 multidrug transporter, MFS superfamily [Actinokineospora spheciospongiae]